MSCWQSNGGEYYASFGCADCAMQSPPPRKGAFPKCMFACNATRKGKSPAVSGLESPPIFW